MNKQEVIDEIENAIPDFILNDYQRGKETGLTYALELAKELDEPEKPVIPQYVAEWLEVCKEKLAISLAGSMNLNILRTNNQSEKTIHWLARNQETFVKAWLYGYEVEKEKLYTAKFKASNEYLNLDRSYKELYFIKVSKDIAEKCSRYHFTKEKLIECSVWNNSAFEIEEVEE